MVMKMGSIGRSGMNGISEKSFLKAADGLFPYTFVKR
jgi:hypothetical protein